MVSHYQFLGATKHLYNWLCPLVCRLVGWSVGNAFVFFVFFWRFLGSFCIAAHAQSHVTDSAVFTALFFSRMLLFFYLRRRLFTTGEELLSGGLADQSVIAGVSVTVGSGSNGVI